MMRAEVVPVLLALMLALVAGSAVAGEQVDCDADQPDAELLEFMAAYEGIDGAWLDPMRFYDTLEANNHATEVKHE
jgi:hypothetical protein